MACPGLYACYTPSPHTSPIFIITCVYLYLCACLRMCTCVYMCTRLCPCMSSQSLSIKPSPSPLLNTDIQKCKPKRLSYTKSSFRQSLDKGERWSWCCILEIKVPPGKGWVPEATHKVWTTYSSFQLVSAVFFLWLPSVLCPVLFGHQPGSLLHSSRV